MTAGSTALRLSIDLQPDWLTFSLHFSSLRGLRAESRTVGLLGFWALSIVCYFEDWICTRPQVKWQWGGYTQLGPTKRAISSVLITSVSWLPSYEACKLRRCVLACKNEQAEASGASRVGPHALRKRKPQASAENRNIAWLPGHYTDNAIITLTRMKFPK